MSPDDWTSSLDPSFRPLSLPLAVTTVSVVFFSLDLSNLPEIKWLTFRPLC